MANHQDTFFVMEGIVDGYRAVATICSSLRDYEHKALTPWFFGFSSPLSSPTPEGLPTTEEAEDLNNWEEDIEKELRSSCKYIFVGRVSWKGYRELLYYVDSPEDPAQKVKLLSDLHKTRRFAYRYEHDPNWTTVKMYLH